MSTSAMSTTLAMDMVSAPTASNVCFIGTSTTNGGLLMANFAGTRIRTTAFVMLGPRGGFNVANLSTTANRNCSFAAMGNGGLTSGGIGGSNGITDIGNIFTISRSSPRGTRNRCAVALTSTGIRNGSGATTSGLFMNTCSLAANNVGACVAAINFNGTSGLSLTVAADGA